MRTALDLFVHSVTGISVARTTARYSTNLGHGSTKAVAQPQCLSRAQRRRFTQHVTVSAGTVSTPVEIISKEHAQPLAKRLHPRILPGQLTGPSSSARLGNDVASSKIGDDIAEVVPKIKVTSAPSRIARRERRIRDQTFRSRAKQLAIENAPQKAADKAEKKRIAQALKLTTLSEAEIERRVKRKEGLKKVSRSLGEKRVRQVKGKADSREAPQLREESKVESQPAEDIDDDEHAIRQMLADAGARVKSRKRDVQREQDTASRMSERRGRGTSPEVRPDGVVISQSAAAVARKASRTAKTVESDKHKKADIKSVDVGSEPKMKKLVWQVQKEALKAKFAAEGWNPRKRVSPDTLNGIRTLHEADPKTYSTPVLSQHLKLSPEAVRRILKSKWQPSEKEIEDRRKRWEKRGERQRAGIARDKQRNKLATELRGDKIRQAKIKVTERFRRERAAQASF